MITGTDEKQVCKLSLSYDDRVERGYLIIVTDRQNRAQIDLGCRLGRRGLFKSRARKGRARTIYSPQTGANDAKRQPGSAPPGQFIRHVPRRAHGAFQVLRRNLLVALKG